MHSLQPQERQIKIDDMYNTLCHEKQFDIICVTETWLDKTIDDEEINMPSYQVFRKDRNRHGGSVAIYVQEAVPVRYLDDFENVGIEIICVEIKHRQKSIIVGCCYRPPGANRRESNAFIDSFQNVINIMLTKSPNSIILLGDFNDRCIIWDDAHPNSELGKRFHQCIEQNLLFQIIKEPTYLEHNYQSLLDLIITDSPGFIIDSGVGCPIGDANHCYVFCKLQMQYTKDKPYTRQIWKYDKGNFESLTSALKMCPWQVMDIFEDIDDATEYFYKLFVDTCKEYIPTQTITINPKDKPWMTDAIKAQLKERDKWFKRWKSSNQVYYYTVFIQKRTEVNISIAEAKSSYFEKLRQKLCDPSLGSKQYWHLLKSLYGSKIDSGIPSIIDGTEVISSAKEKADLFNKHFLKKSTLPVNLPDLPVLQRGVHSISNIDTNEDEVKDILKSLNINKASGYDNISNRLLKNTAEAIAKPLATLFNKSLTLGQFPQKWKKANVPPVFKQNNKQNKNNYRPISLLSNIGKVFERVVFKHLYKFCLENNLLTWRNSGYKPLDSSINQLIYVAHNIYKALEKGEDVCFVSLDASAAFDGIWHTVYC